jgi:quercetin dioxygenase-like cupin family protein
MKQSELVELQSIQFEETPPHSSYYWHQHPTLPYVITLTGRLEFSSVGGETFTIHPGDVLLVEDNTATGPNGA